MSYPVNEAITYTAVAATPGTTGHSFNYAWDFDDATTASTASTAKTWTTTGNHTAVVTATDTTTLATASRSKMVNIMNYNWVLAGQTSGNGSVGNGVYGIQGTKLLIAPNVSGGTATTVYDFVAETFSAGPTLNIGFSNNSGFGSGRFSPAPIAANGFIYLQQSGASAPQLVDIVGGTVITLTAQTFNTFATQRGTQGKDGNIYYMGMTASFNKVYVHNPNTDSWSQKASTAPTAIVGSNPIRISGNKFFTISRQTGNGYVYDADLDTWTTSTNGSGLSLGSDAVYNSILVGNLVYSFGTATLGNRVGSIYNITTNTFTNTSADTVERISPGLFLMENGKIHIVGGRATSATSVLYDPATDSYSSTYATVTAHTHNVLVHPVSLKPFAFGAGSSAPMYANHFDGL